jgi:holo-[acyl-carrier protein] synthase
MAEPNFGIGVDIETISRFKKADAASPFLKKIFMKTELDYCFSCAASAQHLAARFAGKEAIIKAVYCLNRSGLGYKDVEITNDSNGVPSARILRAGFDELRIKLSLSHSRREAIAFAVVTEVK